MAFFRADCPQVALAGQLRLLDWATRQWIERERSLVAQNLLLSRRPRAAGATTAVEEAERMEAGRKRNAAGVCVFQIASDVLRRLGGHLSQSELVSVLRSLRSLGLTDFAKVARAISLTWVKRRMRSATRPGGGGQQLETAANSPYAEE